MADDDGIIWGGVKTTGTIILGCAALCGAVLLAPTALDSIGATLSELGGDATDGIGHIVAEAGSSMTDAGTSLSKTLVENNFLGANDIMSNTANATANKFLTDTDGVAATASHAWDITWGAIKNNPYTTAGITTAAIATPALYNAGQKSQGGTINSNAERIQKQRIAMQNYQANRA